MPLRHTRPIVQRIGGIGGKRVEQTGIDQGLCPAKHLLRRLEDEEDRAVETARARQKFRRSGKHRHVPVMAAGMHGPVNGRGIVNAAVFPDRKRIEFGPEYDAARAAAVLQNADHRRVGQAAMHVQTGGGEPGCDQIGCPMLLEPEFRIGMQVVPQRDNVRDFVFNKVVAVHGFPLGFFSGVVSPVRYHADPAAGLNEIAVSWRAPPCIVPASRHRPP